MNKTKHVPQHSGECKGCENIQFEKDVGGTGHCYMFRKFIPSCQLYKQITTDKNTAIERWKQDSADRNSAIEGRKEAFWQDKDAICRVIAENTFQLDSLHCHEYDSDNTEKAIRAFIDECFTEKAIKDLKL